MDMRRLIDLVEAQKVIQVDQRRTGWGMGGRVTTTVLLNPSIADMKAMIAKAPDNIVKGQVDTDGSIYIWPAFDAVHSDIFTALRLDDPSAFVLSSGPDIKPDDWRRMMPVGERDGVYLFIDKETWAEAGYAKRLRRLFGAEG